MSVTAELLVGAQAKLAPTPYDTSNRPLSGRAFAYSSSAPGIATVDANGVVTAVAIGVATITATAEGKSASATVRVIALVDHLGVSPASAAIVVGGVQQFTASVFDALGNVLSGHVIVWSSSDPAIATIDSSTGLATGAGIGSCVITATCEGKTATAAIGTSAAPGSLADLQTVLVDSNIKHVGSPKLAVNLSGSNVVSVPDVRGGAFPALSVVGTNPPYDAGTGLVTLDGAAARLQSALLSTFAHDPTKDYALAMLGSVPSNAFPTSGMATDDFTATLFEDSGGSTIQCSGSIGAIESNVPLSATPRLAIIQKLKALNTPVNEDSHTTQGIVTFEVWGTPRQVSWSVDPSSASGRITFGGWVGFGSGFAQQAYAGDIKVDKALLLADVQAIQRFATAQNGITAYTGYRPSLLMDIGDSISAGGYLGAGSPVSYIDEVAADAALANYAYAKHALSGIKGYEQAALFDTLHGPDLRPAQWAKAVVVIGLGTNDRFHGSSPGNGSGSAQSAADWITALDGMCAKVRTAHPAAVIVVGTTPDTGFWQQATDTWQQTVNTHVRGMPGAGKCDLVLDFQTIAAWDPIGTPGNFVEVAGQGVHPVQALQDIVKTVLLSLLSGHL